MSFCQARKASIQSSNVAIFFIVDLQTSYHSGFMPVDIDWEGLVVGFESRSRQITHFFDRQTGESSRFSRGTPQSTRR